MTYMVKYQEERRLNPLQLIALVALAEVIGIALLLAAVWLAEKGTV